MNNNIENSNSLIETAKEIRQSFRLLMNGVTSQSMREKGVDYRINWGASLLHLREMAAEYKQDKELAITLWKDNVRECKIIATLLMPHEQFDKELAMQWISQTHTQEIAEIATMTLYQYMPYAYDIAMSLIDNEEDIKQIHAYNILARVFPQNGAKITSDDKSKFLKHAVATLQSENIALKHSAWNAVTHFADMNQQYHTETRKALKSIKMDDWL